MEYILFLSVILGIMTIKEAECQDFMTLNVPQRSPFIYHPNEHLAMDMSEMQPVFLYASSQNDYIHQSLPEHHIVPPNLSRPRQRQRQNSISKPKFINSSPPVQREYKPRNTPQLTYGFQPKPSTNRHINNPLQKKNNPHFQQNQQNEGLSTRHPQTPIHQPSIRHETQLSHNQKKPFAEHISAQTSVHRNRQNENTASSNHQNGFNDFSQPFNYLSHILAPERQFSPTTRPNRNNQLNQNRGVENRKPINNNQRVHKQNEENRQESIRKHVTFEGAAQAFKSRLNNNNQANDGSLPPKTFDNHNRQNLQDRNKNNNERINMQHHARSMRENMPQLPPRPQFNSGGIKINTLAGELPILHLDSINTLNEQPTIYLQTDNHHEHAPTEEQEKKTYILIKAPSVVTTERPSSASFVGTSQKYTSAPYVINNYEETRPNVPEIKHSTLPEPRAVPEIAETPAVVLDLVQIPDHSIFNHQEHQVSPPNPQQPEFRSVDNKYNNGDAFYPTESYPTTPMRPFKDVIHHKKNDYTYVSEDDTNAYYSPPKGRTYSALSTDNSEKYRNKITSIPKIKEFQKSSNISSLPPISYSSSVSVVSVKHNVDTKPSPPKKQKTSVKKALSSKKKVKIPENEHISYDDYYDDEGVPGDPGVDYPTYKGIPHTDFECKNEKAPGFYADTETGCQVFHNCDTGMAKHSFMCPNGTIFNQELFICDWWYNVKCENSPEFYSLNSGLFITDNAHDESLRKA